jgi:FkbM family methyltransferase
MIPSVARYLPRVGVVEAELPSGGVLRLWSRGDDEIASSVFWRGWSGHEPETVAQFFEWARSARVTLDIGAHVGYFSLLAACANPGGRVFAFEPLARVRDRLVRNIDLNGFPNVTALPNAVGSRSGKAEFFHVEDGIPSSSSLSGEFMRSIVDSGRLTRSQVEVTTVDDFVADYGLAGNLDLVKIDTENTEDEVFQGMTTTLATERPIIVCEVLGPRTGEAIESTLTPLGYQFFHLKPGGPVPCDHISPDPAWRNFAFVAPGATNAP